MSKRISKQQLQQMYGVNRKTINTWVNEYGLPMFSTSPYKRYVREDDLLKWESSNIMNSERN